MSDARLYEFLCRPQDYELGDRIGSGSYGAVCVAIKKSDGTQVAHKQGHKSLHENDTEGQRLFYREVSILAKLRTRLCLPLIGFWIPDESDKGPVILSPLMNNGTLEELIDRESKCRHPFSVLSPTQIVKFAYGIAYGMRICHGFNIVHRDLKPENVFVSSDFLPVIADFGLSKCLTGSVEASRDAGSPLYMAPEMIKRESFNKAVDVYSYGILLYQLIGRTKDVIFEGRAAPFQTPFGVMSAVEAGARPKRLDSIPDFWWELMTNCWDQVPAQRRTFDQIVAVLDDSREATLPGVDDTEYEAFKLECHAEGVEGEMMPLTASLTGSIGFSIGVPSAAPTNPSPATPRMGRKQRSFKWKT